MGRLAHAESFQDLLVYQKARELWREIFDLTRGFPREEKYSLTDQILRSSRAVGAQIAEAWGKRRYERHFISKLTDADSEQMETQHWIGVAMDCHYIDAATASRLTRRCQEIGRMLAGMMQKSSAFCGTPTFKISEETAPYFISPDDH